MTESITDQTPDEVTDPTPENSKSGRARLAIAALLGVLAIVAQMLAPWTDHQIANIASFAFCVFASALCFVWWHKQFSDRGFFRYLPLAVLVALTAYYASAYRFAGVSGELVPQFVPRNQQGDEALPDATGLESIEIDPESSLTGTFAGFLGNDHTGIIPRRDFSTDWDQSPPELLFHQPIGAAWSGVAIEGSYGFTMEQRDDQEWTTCYELDSGKLVWKHVVQQRHYHPLGGLGPRATPMILPDCIVTQGATGIVSCLVKSTGAAIWEIDLLDLAGIDQADSEAGVTWGRSASPLITDDKVIVPLGGKDDEKSALVALALESGSEIWRCKPDGEFGQISYTSPALMTILGDRQIVSINENNVAGYKIEDGTLLWRHDWPGSSNGGASCSQPVRIGENQILLSKAYGGGSQLLEATRDDQSGQIQMTSVWHISGILKTKFTNLVVKDEYAYGLSDGILECAEIATGKRRWRQSRRGRYQQGQLLLVEDTLLVLAEDGRVALVDANPNEFNELAMIEALSGTTWNIPSVAGRRLVVRNATEIASYQLPARTN